MNFAASRYLTDLFQNFFFDFFSILWGILTNIANGVADRARIRCYSWRRINDRGFGDAGAVDGVDGEDIFRVDIETMDVEAGGVVDLVIAEEPVAREAVADDIEVCASYRRPGDRGVTAVGWIATDFYAFDCRGRTAQGRTEDAEIIERETT